MARKTQMLAAEIKVIELTCEMIDRVADRITAEASWDMLTKFFYDELVHNRTLSTAQILAWAEAGHPAADRALRRHAAEMIDSGREGQLLAQVKAYAVKMLIKPFVAFPRGRHVVQTLMRDIWLPMVVQRVADGTGLSPTRSLSAVEPSAAFL